MFILSGEFVSDSVFCFLSIICFIVVLLVIKSAMDRNMDRMTFGRKTLNAPRPRLDRFVATRESFPEMHRRVIWGDRCNLGNDDIWFTKYRKQKQYMNYLDKAFGLESLKVKGRKEEPQGRCLPPWPCIPRKKCYLSSADSILDLPTYSYAAFPELLDWSNENILVAALGRNYHKWSWRTQNLISEGFTEYDIQCCKFDPRGELLALGTNMKMVEIHDNALSKWIISKSCQCAKEDQFCSITAVDWSPTGNSFITGCSRGMLVSRCRQAQIIRWYQAVDVAIMVVRVSPDARYVVASAVNGQAVMLLSWPSLGLYASLKSDWTVKALAWHPWRSALLGIGTVTSSLHARFTLWNAPSEVVKETALSRTPFSLDAMLFSHLTGELVLSLWNADRALSHKACSQLVVMSDPETVVDQWGEGRAGLDRVRAMIFSPDGTKLATATADEDLIIWNFLPESKKNKKNCKTFSAIPVYLDEASYGVSLR